MKSLAFFAFVLLSLSLQFACFADTQGVFFSGISTDKDSYSQGSILSIQTTIMNRDQSPNVNLTVHWKLVRNSDGALVSIDSDQLSLAASEVQTINKTLAIPDKILSGNYTALVEAISSSGAPISSVYAEVSIDSGMEEGVLFGREGIYLKVPVTRTIAEGITQTNTKYIYGFTGDTIPRGNPIFAEFRLTNPGGSDLILSSKLKAVASYRQIYSTQNQTSIESQLGVLKPGETKSYSIGFSIDKPGTYSVIVSIYSGDDFLAQKEVRAVISGEDGTILSVKNGKDTYESGETFGCRVSYVGPADKSVVDGAYLQVRVLSDGKVVNTIRKESIQLSTQEMSADFSFKVPYSLMNYDVETELGKGDVIFDKVTNNYEPMNPDTTLTDDGRILPKGEGCFDDGVCTDAESKIGDCLDCVPMGQSVQKQEFEQYYWPVGIIVTILVIIILLLYMARSRK